MLFKVQDGRRFSVNATLRCVLASALLRAVREEYDHALRSVNETRLNVAEILLNNPRRVPISYEELIKVVQPVDTQNRLNWGYFRDPIPKRKK